MTQSIALKRLERIIAVVPEYCHGPGWSNTVVWVYISNEKEQLRTECLQFEDQSYEMYALFAPGAAMHTALVNAVPVSME